MASWESSHGTKALFVEWLSLGGWVGGDTLIVLFIIDVCEEG